jgi:hypothetical protein
MYSDLSTHGFIAYDAGLQTEVLVMPFVLCFLGDSPMHAEIANTPMPSTALNPCRTCKLAAPGKGAKSTHDYVNDFLGKNADGEKVFHIISPNDSIYAVLTTQNIIL